MGRYPSGSSIGLNIVGRRPVFKAKHNEPVIAKTRSYRRTHPCIWKLQYLKTERGWLVTGTVLRKGTRPVEPDGSWWDVLIKTIRTYFLKAYKGRMVFSDGSERHETYADGRGNFEIETANVELVDPQFSVAASGEKIPVVHTYPTRFDYSDAPTIVISDIDDTILVSNSSRFFSKIWLMLFRQTAKRNFVEETEQAYRRLAKAGLPFIYVSASEMNLYSTISNFLQYHDLPLGAIYLRPYQHWRDLLKERIRLNYKMDRIEKIMDRFDKAKFILFGDDSQSDPDVFEQITKKYPKNVRGVFIRKTGIGRGKKGPVTPWDLPHSDMGVRCYSKFSEIEPQINQVISETTHSH